MNRPTPEFALNASLATKALPSLKQLKSIRTESVARASVTDIGAFVYEWIMAADFKMAKACLDLLYEKKCKTGILMRGDGVTPSVLHELTQAIYTIALATHKFPLPDVERLLCLNFTHDLGEEFNVHPQDLRERLLKSDLEDVDAIIELEAQFEALTKARKDSQGRNIKKYKTNREYFMSMCDDPCTMLAKYLDRIHNVATLIGVKTPEKIREYVEETLDLMACFKEHEDKYPAYDSTFNTLRKLLSAQIHYTSEYYNSLCPQTPLPHLSKVQLSNKIELPSDQKINLSQRNVPEGLDALLIPQARVRMAQYDKRARQDPQTPNP